MLGQKCHFAHGDAELRKPDDPITQEVMNLALKSVQWHNCNQGGRGMRGGGGNDGGRGNGMSRGGGRGGFRGGQQQHNPNGGGGRGGYQ
jgi:hypothetical protein